MKNYSLLAGAYPLISMVKVTLLISLLLLTSALACKANPNASLSTTTEAPYLSAPLSVKLEQQMKSLWIHGIPKEQRQTTPPQSPFKLKRNLDKTLILGGSSVQPM